MKLLPTTLSAICALSTNAFAANEYTDQLTDIANQTIAQWVTAPVVVNTLRAQNRAHEGLSEGQINELDASWRQQVISGGDLITTVLSNPLSLHLKDLKAQGAGRFTEIFISDNRGLNAGQSDVTSDYWQGDEDKWQVPTASRKIHIGDVEFDESSQSYQSQVSVPILDAGEFIGVITVGIDLEQIIAAN